jgi:exopolyphosphatase/guanosine-5'-triphosphate,3'-diphosphate pyrophosphatase
MIQEDQKVLTLPIRVASIDVGSNALRFLAAELTNRADFKILSYDRHPLRLGHDVFLLGRMKDKTIDSALRCMKTFKSNLKNLNIEQYRAIATSAVRESSNGDELIIRMRERVGINLEIISGSEEARLIHLAVKQRFPLGNEKWILVDVGGGSVEVSLVDKKGILWSESHTMGAVRLLNMFEGPSQEPRKFKKLIEEYIQTIRIPNLIQGNKPAECIATGGNIEAIASLIDLSGQEGISRVPIQDLNNLIEKLSCLSYDERIRELDLKEDRADVILPASLIYKRLAVLAGSEEIIVPHAELREGVLLDLVDVLLHRTTKRN